MKYVRPLIYSTIPLSPVQRTFVLKAVSSSSSKSSAHITELHHPDPSMIVTPDERPELLDLPSILEEARSRVSRVRCPLDETSASVEGAAPTEGAAVPPTNRPMWDSRVYCIFEITDRSEVETNVKSMRVRYRAVDLHGRAGVFSDVGAEYRIRTWVWEWGMIGASLTES